MNNKIPGHSAEGLQQVPSVFIEYLKTRGIEGDKAVNKFLYPVLMDLPRPEIMKNLQAASKLVIEYMIARKQIIIWGDYDVDGTTGTALLVNFFKQLGTEARWHIPDRMEEGYGLNSRWFTNPENISLAEDFLLITVDCGISNFEQIEVVKKIGGKVIVTDHHSLPIESMPDCIILNPSQPSCGFHGAQLAGVGVAFYLAAGIRVALSVYPQFKKAASQLNLKQYLAFVALGTVADVVDLTETNRILVRAGLEALLESQFVGLQKLLLSCDITGGCVTSEDIGYLIGPKINAAGRLGESKVVVELLTAQDSKKAGQLAQKLTDLNTERRRVSDDNLETALTSLSTALLQENKCAIVKGHLHQGVAGIVASRLVDKFKVPAIVFAQKEQEDGQLFYVGSARSVENINIIGLLTECGEWIEKFGGHEMAAGLTVSHKNMQNFEKKFISLARIAMEEKTIIPKKRFDIRCPAELIMDKEHLKCIRLLEPFGPGNPQPVFQDSAVTIIDSRAVGREAEHLQVTIRSKYSNMKGIGFNLGCRLNDIQQNPERTMIYTPTMNRFRGTVNWQVRVIDI